MKFRLRKDFVALAIGVIIILFVVNFISSRHFLRFDLTANKEYTLSPSTKNILKNLDDVVNLQIYFTKDLPPALLHLKRSVDDTLSEYKTYAGGKLKIQYIYPEDSPETEAKVRLMGIPPLQLNVIHKDKQELVKIYLGLSVVHKGRTEVLPVVQNTSSLEYDLTAAILAVSRKEKPVIKWFSNTEGLYSGIKELLKKRYDVVDVDSGSLELDPAKDTILVLAADQDIDEKNISKVDDYLANGGKVFVMVDRIKVGNNLKTSPTELTNIAAWLGKSGVTVEDKLVLDRSNTHAAFAGGYVTYHVPYPYWVKVTSGGLDPENSATGGLDSLILPWTSPLLIEEGSEYVILAKSSKANRIAPLDSSLLPEDAQLSMANAGSEPAALAVFKKGQNNGAITVIGNARFVQDNFLRQFTENALFFENVMDFMSTDNELIGIRSKSSGDRQIAELTPTGIGLVKYLNVLGAPVVLLTVGAVVGVRRKRRRQTLRKTYLS